MSNNTKTRSTTAEVIADAVTRMSIERFTMSLIAVLIGVLLWKLPEMMQCSPADNHNISSAIIKTDRSSTG